MVSTTPSMNPRIAILAALVIAIILGVILWFFVFKKSDETPVIEIMGPSVGSSDEMLLPVETVDVIEDALTGSPETTGEPEGYCIRN